MQKNTLKETFQAAQPGYSMPGIPGMLVWLALAFCFYVLLLLSCVSKGSLQERLMSLKDW